jgi:hypothetical protein
VLALGASIWCTAAGAQEQDHAKPILDKAATALGGADKQKLAGITFDSQAKLTIGTEEIDFGGSWTVKGHDKLNGNLNVKVNGRQENVTVVMNAKQIWAQGPNGKTEAAPAEVVPSVQAVFRAVLFAQRPGLLASKDFKLSPLGELLVNNVTCVGLKIEQKDFKELSLHFDKATGLPAKAEMTIREGGGGDVNYVFLFSEYKEVDGVKHFTKVAVERDQKHVANVEISNIRLHESLNENVFMKP